ncbi:hypothetical protein QBC34DRAFT_405359 [Podospora aff. communis PSN243]|uniref:N-acetyltransferase domain-containing protein n=1 Tax=Podospora aff. communis PSN243 TaxID=3040156 RepID=A0AAV9GPF4_9PEZI|nr:hypothetical protein QBC34DRAFT_405359 [Podospora aff. communis PSN243]
MPPNITLQDTPSPPAPLITLLTSHLPHSLPVLRRLQSCLSLSASTPQTHILYASSLTTFPNHFAAAYLDLTRSPETECWLYSTLEDASTSYPPSNLSLSLPQEEAQLCDELVMAILRRARLLEEELSGEGVVRTVGKGKMVLGSLNEVVRQRIMKRGVQMAKTAAVEEAVEWEFCGKWLFRVEELPFGGRDGLEELEEGVIWDVCRRGDVRIVQSRTVVPRLEATLLMLPSTVLRLENGTPVAWAFLGLDGTFMTLHVEEAYRGKGLAKALACRLIRDHLKTYGDDGWGAADVFVSNVKSRAVCKSIGGKPCWTSSWAILDLSSAGGSM